VIGNRRAGPPYSGIGGLVGVMQGGAITHCNADCSVLGTAEHRDALGGIGGLVGTLEKGSISNCHTSGDVTCADMVGGLAGYCSNATITCSYSTSTIRGGENIGGLIGWLMPLGEIAGCYSAGNVIGENCVGGLVGLNSNIISNCYASGHVEGQERVGGLVGSNVYIRSILSNDIVGGDISCCYSTAWVNGRDEVGGLVGCNTERGYHGTVTASFWDVERSEQESSAGGTGKTTMEMRESETYTSAGWDFTTPIWSFSEDGPPPLLKCIIR
jgi:hypothetical protein